MFRYKSGIKVPYKRQMYIYSISRLYNELDEKSQAKIRELCAEYGGEYERALFEFVTTDTTATAAMPAATAMTWGRFISWAA